MKPSSSQAFPSALQPYAVRVSYDPSSVVFRTGSPARAVYFVEAGAVRLIRYGRAGEQVVLHHARSGEFFAEASLDSAHYHCDAVASEPTILWQVAATELKALLNSDRAFSWQWIALLSRQLRNARARVERVSLKNAADRVHHLLASQGRGPHCELVIEGTLKDLALALGLSHETLYRTLAQMERDGQLQRQGKLLRLAR